MSDGDKTYETIVLPRALTAQILKMAHDDLGHNGTHRTFTLLTKIILLERFKTKGNKTHTEMLSLSKEK